MKDWQSSRPLDEKRDAALSEKLGSKTGGFKSLFTPVLANNEADAESAGLVWVSVGWPFLQPHPTCSSPLCSPAAGDPAGSQAAAQWGRLPDQSCLRLLGEEAQELPGALAHPPDQAGEEGRLHQQRPLRGLPQEDGEDADQKGDLAADAAWALTFPP